VAASKELVKASQGRTEDELWELQQQHSAAVFVYRSGDPRAVVLLGRVRRAAPKSGQLAVAEAVLAEAVDASPQRRRPA
jgi:hypothetical protein